MTVSLRDLTIRYGEIIAVDQASAEFPAGAVGLLGRNGAGKSSILRALLGLVRPASGSLTILGMSAETAGAEIRRRVGYMPERDGHVTGLNGFETVCLAGELTGLPPPAPSRRAPPGSGTPTRPCGRGTAERRRSSTPSPGATPRPAWG